MITNLYDTFLIPNSGYKAFFEELGEKIATYPLPIQIANPYIQHNRIYISGQMVYVTFNQKIDESFAIYPIFTIFAINKKDNEKEYSAYRAISRFQADFGSTDFALFPTAF